MTPSRWRGSVSRLALAIVLWTAVPSCVGLAGTPPITEAQVKAAYLYNFAKFIGWPEQSFPNVNAPIEICVLSDSGFESTLKQIVSSRSIDGRLVQVLSIQAVTEARGCHIVFISSSQDKQARALIDSLHNSGVVTVGETQGFLEQGGMIDFALQDGRVQFQVNLKAATQAGLHISARLLGVANRVIQ